eukprot:gene37557-45616_t
MDKSDKAKRTKVSKFSLDGLKEAREGKVSRLDQLELDEDDNVYELVDEDKYTELVEERRKAGDFVVDDDGLGYYDDGEEILGVGEDGFDLKKRLKEASKQEDMKVAKKARKLAEDTIGQKNTMLKHLSNVPTAPKTSSRGPTMQYDLDALLTQSGPKAGASKPLMGFAGVARPRTILQMGMGKSSSFQASFGMNSVFTGDDDDVPREDPAQDFPDYHMDVHMDEPADRLGSLEQSQATPEKEVGGVMEVTPEPSAGVTVKDEPMQKISLTKTTKTLKITAPIKPAVTPDENLKSLMPTSQGSAMPTFVDSDAPVSVSGGQKIDSKSWLLETPAEGNQPAEQYVRMYWLDATELNGVIYLFGRVPVASADPKQPPRFVSCCAIVQG